MFEEMKKQSPPDLMRFIPSKDVREHLKEIGWQPDALQAARLVLKNDTIPLYEKLQVLRQITETLPDVLLDLPSFVENGDTLQECLSAYVQDEEELLASFYDNKNAIFITKGFEGGSRFCYRSVACTSLDLCMDKVLEGIPNDRRSSGHFDVSKFYTNEQLVFSVTFNADRQPIGRTGCPNRKTKEINELLIEPLTLPHPFRRFDLVWLPREKDEYYMIIKSPILLDRLPDPASLKLNNRQSAAGYCCIGNHLDYVTSLPIAELEYLPKGSNASEEGILLRLRDYLSGTIPLCSFTNSFAAFCMRSAADWVDGDDYESDEPTTPIPPVDDAALVGDDDFPF